MLMTLLTHIPGSFDDKFKIYILWSSLFQNLSLHVVSISCKNQVHTLIVSAYLPLLLGNLPTG